MYQNRPRDFLLGVLLGYKVKQAFAAQMIQFPRLGIVDMTLILHFKVHNYVIFDLRIGDLDLFQGHKDGESIWFSLRFSE